VARGGTCDDPCCAALYSCETSGWQLVETCRSNGAGCNGGASGVGGAGGGAGEAEGGGGCSPAAIDHTGEHSNCNPDLVEAPDCPVEAAESCHPCMTGCSDFFLCMSDGWELVAFCTEEGEIVVVQ
jgi:hypothetical protein